MATEKGLIISAVCRQLGYSKQSYYKSLTRSKTRFCHKSIAKQKVLQLRAQMPYLGTRKLYYLLKKTFEKEQIRIGRDGLFDLLREEGLLVATKKRYTKTTNSKHWMHKYPNLIQHMAVNRPEQLWVADITYVAVAQGYCYVHLITDAYSKQIMGYYTSESLAATSTLKALQMALSKRQYKDQLTHHSDRGLQYCSGLYTKLLAQNNIAVSMIESGSPYDNAIAERVNGILKQEFGLDQTFETIEEVSKQLKQSVNTYNSQRPHLSNSLLTPNQMHQQNILKPKPWHKKTTRTFEDSYGFLPSLLY